MRLEEAKQILNNEGYLLEDTETNDDEVASLDFWNRVAAENKHMDLEDKIDNAKKFNTSSDKKDIVAAFKVIKAMAGKGGWKFEDDSKPDDFFNIKELTNGTLERVIKQNKGFYTIIINLRKILNKFNDFAEILLLVTPQGNTEIRVSVNDKKEKIFDVSEYETAIKYAKWIH